MKQQTAMQELIQWMANMPTPFASSLFKKATELLEKEEEQIKQAYERGIKDATEINTSDF